MNYIPNLKANVLINELTKNNLLIQALQSDADCKKLRPLIDQRRQIKADLANELNLSNFDKEYVGDSLQDTYEKTEIIVNSWVQQIHHISSDQINFNNQQFCEMFLDNALPSAWHFKNDAIVVIDPPSNQIVHCAAERGQKLVIVYYTSQCNSVFSRHTEHNCDLHICLSYEDLEHTFALLQTPTQQIITIPCENNSQTFNDAKQAITDAIKAGKRTRFENTRTVSKFGKSWAHNILKNLREIPKARNLHDLQVANVEDAVIVASGPSLNRNINVLKEMQDSVFVISALRSLPVLINAGISPDLVIQLDAESPEVARDLTLNGDHQIRNFLIEGVVDPGFLKIKAQNTIWSLSQHFFDIHQVLGSKPTPFTGPSVSIYALYLCKYLNFRNICFIGQDLAAEGDKQYADGATNLLPAHAKMSMFQIEVPGFYGTPVMTRNSYQYQIERCKEIAHGWAKTHPDLNLFNATEGGAFIEGFRHISLRTFGELRKLSDKKKQKQISFGNEYPVTADTVECFLGDFARKMDQATSIATTIVKLDKQAEKTRGLNKKLRKSIAKFQSVNDSTSLLQIAMQDRISKIIGTSGDGQKIDGYKEFFDEIKTCACALKGAAKN